MSAPRNPNAVTGLWPPARTTTCPLCGRTVSVLAIEPDGACERCHTAEPPPDHLGLPHDADGDAPSSPALAPCLDDDLPSDAAVAIYEGAHVARVEYAPVSRAVVARVLRVASRGGVL